MEFIQAFVDNLFLLPIIFIVVLGIHYFLGDIK